MTYTIESVITLIGAHRYGTTDAKIAFLLTDSRSLCFPEETLFFAIRSGRNDGHRYIPELYRRGVTNFVVSEVPENWAEDFPHANFLVVPSPLKALQTIAAEHRRHFAVPVVGITGSNGKTMVKEWLYRLLAPQWRVTRSPKSYNSQIGVPLSVWLLNRKTEIALFEAGISEPGEMTSLHDIIRPTVAVLTNVGAPHQENFASMRAKCEEKLKLFAGAQTVVYNADDKLIADCVQALPVEAHAVAWSEHDPSAAFYVKTVEKHASSTTLTYIYNGEEHAFSIPFIDEASIQNAEISALVALLLGVTPLALTERMPLLEPVAMRLEVKEGLRGCTLINDSYNSDINSLDIALDFMNRRPDRLGRKRTLVLSDISQSGEDPETLYRTVAHLVEHRGVRKLVAIGPCLKRFAHLFHVPEQLFFDTTVAFLSSPDFKALHNEVILLKGARHFEFDRITELLVHKVHETTLEVNLSAMVENLNRYRSFLKPATKMVCMIKADGYGTGAVEIAKTLQDHRVDYLAVAVADEGATLRRNGITANIMVMNPEMSAFKTQFDYELEPEVYSFRLLEALVQAARKEGISHYPVHIKLDTGMHRLGFDPEHDMDALIELLQAQNAVMPRSVFSHFVGSDSDAFDSFSDRQFALFDAASRRLQSAFDHHILRHIDNSAGIEHFPERQLDMCRLGLGLYGVNPRNNAILHNVATLKTTILQLRKVPKTDTVGYSRRGTLERDSVIAAIPIGYADGLNRRLGNRRCYCLVNGKPAPYVGNICMDVAMIDVTGIDCREGDAVEIFGDHLPVTVLSDALETIPYEVLTGISNRVKRVYFQD